MHTTALKQLGISLLRTVVTSVWSLFIGWLILVLPIFEPFRQQLLALSELALPVLLAVIGAAWYAFWRWLEPLLPDWLTAALLGSSRAPVYAAAGVSTATAAQPANPSAGRRQAEIVIEETTDIVIEDDGRPGRYSAGSDR